MLEQPARIAFSGRLVMIGFGSIGQGVLALLLKHLSLTRERVLIISADEQGRAVAEAQSVAFQVHTLTGQNLDEILQPLLEAGDFLLNLSVDVSSLALMRLAHRCGALYLDTCTEPWPGGYTDASVPAADRTNYALREAVLTLREELVGGPTALVTHGANPGLVSHFVKQALLDLAQDLPGAIPQPTSREAWAKLAQRLGVKVIHIAERDTQQALARPKRLDEFVNTWSVAGFIGEGCQPAELGWGTHERHWPAQASRHDSGCHSAIYLNQPGAGTRVRTWTPLAGAFFGFLITHAESISIADYFTVRENGEVKYRPTVHYAYHPCNDAVLSLHEFAGRSWQPQSRQHILVDEISSGMDELGVLLAGHDRNAYWYGSRLSIDQARALAPNNNATSLQVCAAVLAGMIWTIEHPARGIVEPDELDHAELLALAAPYLGELVGAYGAWHPLSGRSRLFTEDVDASDPWQFRNVLVS